MEKWNRPILAMDEAGRGPLAGPVAVGGVLLNREALLKNDVFKDGWWRKVNDSKKLSEKKRVELADKIKSSFPSTAFLISAVFIDQYGIASAIKTAAEKGFFALA